MYRRPIRGAGKSLARPGRKQATFPAFYETWRFITTFTTVHHLSLPQPNQSIPLPITLLTGATCLLPCRAKDLSAPRYTVCRVTGLQEQVAAFLLPYETERVVDACEGEE